jgi:large-conductance mechanosensitive channel
MPAGFGFLYITFLKDFYRELKETRLKTKKVELAIGIVYSIMFGMTVILILYGIISVIINS